MRKNYWTDMLASKLDERVRELDKELEPIRKEVAEKYFVGKLGELTPEAQELYTQWKRFQADADDLDKALDDAKKKSSRAKAHFFREVDYDGYYSSTTPESWINGQVQRDVREEVLDSTDQGAEIKRLNAIRPKIFMIIEGARTEKKILEAVSKLAERIGISLDLD